MPEPRAQRTLVKSPPELWAELSDLEALARHLGEFGEIRITRLEPETTVAWEGDRARGTVELEPAGWGTKVTITAKLAAAEAPTVAIEAVAAEPVAPEPVSLFEPVTEKKTLTPAVGFPNSSVTVAVTQCWVLTSFVAVAGATMTIAGGPGVTSIVSLPKLPAWIEAGAGW